MLNMIDLNNAQIRIERKDAKIERQAKIITRLETSRIALKKENKELREQIVLLDAETEALGVLLSPLVDIELERDKLLEQLKNKKE